MGDNLVVWKTADRLLGCLESKGDEGVPTVVVRPDYGRAQTPKRGAPTLPHRQPGVAEEFQEGELHNQICRWRVLEPKDVP